MKSVEYTDRLPTIKITPIIVGERDECEAAVSKAIEEKIPGSKLGDHVQRRAHGVRGSAQIVRASYR